MKFVYVRIRHGEASVGVGSSHYEAAHKAEVVKVSEDFAGVTDIEDAIHVLHEFGYKVKSIVVPEHVRELE